MRPSDPVTGKLSVFALLLGRLEEAGVVHALLRDAPEDADLVELDLLVWPRERARFDREAGALGFVRCRRSPPLKDVYVQCDGARLRILDVHYAFVQGGIVYLPLPDPASLGTRRSLPPEEQALHLFFHSLLGKGGVQAKHDALVRALAAGGLDRERAGRLLGDATLQPLFDSFLTAPEQLRAGSEEGAAAARRVRRRLLRAPSNFLRHLRARLPRRRRGLLAVFMGVDGAGKSTTIERVVDRLSSLPRVRFAQVYMGPWGQFRTRLLAWAYRRGLSPPEEQWLRRAVRREGPLLHCLSKWVRGQVRGLLYYAAVSWDLWQRYRHEIRPRLRRGELVLCDRYVHDLRYLHHGKPIAVLPLARRLVCFLFPRPHVVFFLHNEPEVIHARKPQLEVEEIRRFQEIYRRALAGLSVVELRTDRAADEVAGDVVRTAVARLFRRS